MTRVPHPRVSSFALAGLAVALAAAACDSSAQTGRAEAASAASAATPVAAPPPDGAFVGIVTVRGLPVRVTLQMKGEDDAVVTYGPTLSCSLALAFIVQTGDGYAYAFKPASGGSAGMAPYCNRLLGGRAWLKPFGQSRGFSYLPQDDRGTPLEHTAVDPVPAKR
jgi:hypothetical protein